MKFYFLRGFLVLALILTTCLSFSQSTAIIDLMNKQEYPKAIELLTAKTTIDKMDNESLVNLGYCYIMTKDFKNAEVIFLELSQRKRSTKENTLYYAELLLINGKYDDAKQNYLKYLEKDPENQLVKVKVLACDSLTVWNSMPPSSIIVKNHNLINSPHHEMSAISHIDEIIYASNKPPKESTSNQAGPVWKYYDLDGNLFAPSVFAQYSCGVLAWCSQARISAFSVKKVTQNIHDISLGNSQILIIYGDNIVTGKSEMFGWENMPSGVNIAHPSFSLSGKRLYFASDMPGGFGGMDIYYSDFKDSKWGTPVNLGINVNTPFDDLFPVVSGDSILYFSSAGHPGYGNLDIFKVHIIGNSFSKPVNLKKPVNSIGDDFSFITLDPNNGYFTSNRSSMSKGGFDIFEWNIPVIEVPQPKDPDPIHVFDPISLPLYSILFETSSSEVKPQFHHMLKTLADSMKLYPYIQIQITAYTDITGTDSYNEKLSIDRATAVANFLVQQGVNNSQINVQGKGKSDHEKLAGIKYHAQIGSLTSNDGIQWFEKFIANAYPVIALPYGKRYTYLAGEFNSFAEAKEVVTVLRSKNIDCFVVASYFGQRLPDYILSVNRKADIEYKILEGQKKKNTSPSEDLNKAKQGDLIQLPNIQFHPGTATPLETSFPTLKELSNFLQSNTLVEIEIHGHICCEPIDEMNLSTARARFVHEYLIQQGIDSQRMSYKGFGRTKPITDESTPEKAQQNRRVEILIVKM
jgi:outer membrane protein OmpA-like peptidoglycan-associated protein